MEQRPLGQALVSCGSGSDMLAPQTKMMSILEREKRKIGNEHASRSRVQVCRQLLKRF